MTREKICNSMTVQDAVRVLKETNCYGTMDIAKSVILKALEQQPKTDILDKIKAEIQNLRNCSCSCSDGIIDDVEDIIDKYKAGSEENNE